MTHGPVHNRIFIGFAVYRGDGWQASRARAAMGRRKRLGVKQSRWVYDSVTTKSPLQFKRSSLRLSQRHDLGSEEQDFSDAQSPRRSHTAASWLRPSRRLRLCRISPRLLRRSPEHQCQQITNIAVCLHRMPQRYVWIDLVAIAPALA